MEGLTEGRMVHFVMPDGQHRPAVVVRVWREVVSACEGYVNLQVFTDSSNDILDDDMLTSFDAKAIRRGVLWKTSVCYDEEKSIGTWHWIEKA